MDCNKKLTIVSEVFTINVLLTLALSLASVLSYDSKWCRNLEGHLLMILEASFMTVIIL